MTPPKPISANPSPITDIGDIHGLHLSPAPRLQDSASLRTIPLGRNAIGDAIHGGKPRDQWLANLDRRLAHVQRGRQPGARPVNQAHASPLRGSAGIHVARAHQLRPSGQATHVRPAHGHSTATAGRTTRPTQQARPQPQLTNVYVTHNGQRTAMAVPLFRSNAALTNAVNKGEVRPGETVALVNSRGQQLPYIVYRSRTDHNIHWTPAR